MFEGASQSFSHEEVGFITYAELDKADKDIDELIASLGARPVALVSLSVFW